MSKESKGIDYESQGVLNLREILSKNQATLVTDLDDTIKEPNNIDWQDGTKRRYVPELITALKTLKSRNLRIGIATEQGFPQIETFIKELARQVLKTDDYFQLFDGPIISEGGSVFVSKEKGLTVLAPKRSIIEKNMIMNWVRKNTQPSSMEGWSILNGTEPGKATYIQVPNEKDECLATASLWEKGPRITEVPEFIPRYKIIEDRIRSAMSELNITTLTTYEAGNGTLRIVPKFVNKAHSVELLSAYGVLDLSKTVYSCDGPNDVGLARIIKKKQGGVIAVANGVNELHEIANFSATKASGAGFAEAVSKLYPHDYALNATHTVESVARLQTDKVKLIEASWKE